MFLYGLMIFLAPSFFFVFSIIALYKFLQIHSDIHWFVTREQNGTGEHSDVWITLGVGSIVAVLLAFLFWFVVGAEINSIISALVR